MFLTAFLMIVLIKYNEKVPPQKIYSISTYYSYIVKPDEKISINLYFNSDTYMLDLSYYQDTYIANSDETKKLSVQLNEIKYKQTETYLGETYDCYSFIFMMPSLNQSFYINDALLYLYMINDDHYALKIGDISLYYMNSSEVDYLDWTSLSATKDEGILLSRMHDLYIEYVHIDKQINHIYLGYDYEVEFHINDDLISIMIPYDDFLLYACPIMILYSNDEIQIIDYFVYIKDYQILKESGMLLHGYLLS